MRATTLFNLQRNNIACKLKKNVARITGPLGGTLTIKGRFFYFYKYTV